MTLTVATSGASGYNIEKVRSCFGPRELFAPLQFTKNLAKASSGPAVLKGGHVSGQNIELGKGMESPFIWWRSDVRLDVPTQTNQELLSSMVCFTS